MSPEVMEATEKLRRENEALRSEIEVLRKENGSLRSQTRSLQEKVDLLLRRHFGRKSEKLPPGQLLFFEELFQEAEAEVEAEKAEREKESVPDWVWERRRRRKGGRGPLPENLPRRREEIHPEGKERTCASCGNEMQPIGEEVTEELDYNPAQLYVREIARIKYGCRGCQEGIVIAPLPPRPIDKGRPGVGLLAHVAVSKYGDHLPLYRQEQIFARHGFALSRSTLCDWLGAVALLLEPLVEAMKGFILASPLIQSDDTHVDVRSFEKGNKVVRGFLWVYSIPRAEVVYDFSLGRGQEVPARFLGGYRGHIQSDGYRGYSSVIGIDGERHLGCWAHVRRRFYEALRTAPNEARAVLVLIQGLYRIERRAREEGLDLLLRAKLREKEALPLIEELEPVLQELKPKTNPLSPLGKAITYATGEWQALKRYAAVPEAEIDNNSAEQAMRNIVLGRKNWLFLGSAEGGGRRATVLYSLIESCKRLKVEPFGYLKDVIERVSVHPASRIWELTPRGWRDARGGEAAQGGVAQSDPPTSRADSAGMGPRAPP